MMEALLKIVDKNGRLIPLKPNRSQRYFFENRTNKDLILKYRQGGVSTGLLADYFLDCIIPDPVTGLSNVAAVLFSYDDESTQRLLAKVDTFYANLPEPKPYMSRDSMHLKTFPELGSRLYIGTAGARVAGLGDTINRAHFSEFSYWADNQAKRIREGVEQAVPLGGKITIENTANGEGGEFYNMWSDEDSAYGKMFLPWYWHEEYRLPEGSLFTNEQDRGKIEFTDEEVDVMGKYGLDEEQVRWRRMKKRETKEMFPQWYPEDPITCFLSSGGSIFSENIIRYLSSLCCRAPVEDDSLRQWELPQSGEKYVVGVDASDPDPTKVSLQADYCGAVVMSSKFRHVATLRGRWEPHAFASRLAKLGSLYNGAYLIVERNNVGSAVLTCLEQIERYPYMHKTAGRLGWVANAPSKIALVSLLKEMVESFGVYTRDDVLVRELRSFRKLEGAKYGAKAGAHDDLVICLGLALEAMTRSAGVIQVDTSSRSGAYGWAAKGW